MSKKKMLLLMTSIIIVVAIAVGIILLFMLKEAEIESTGECNKWKNEMRAENVTPTGIVLVLERNNTEADATKLITGEPYSLEVKKGNDWEIVPTEYNAWDMPAYSIFPVSTREWKIE